MLVRSAVDGDRLRGMVIAAAFSLSACAPDVSAVFGASEGGDAGGGGGGGGTTATDGGGTTGTTGNTGTAGTTSPGGTTTLVCDVDPSADLDDDGFTPAEGIAATATRGSVRARSTSRAPCSTTTATGRSTRWSQLRRAGGARQPVPAGGGGGGRPVQGVAARQGLGDRVGGVGAAGRVAEAGRRAGAGVRAGARGGAEFRAERGAAAGDARAAPAERDGAAAERSGVPEPGRVLEGVRTRGAGGLPQGERVVPGGRCRGRRTTGRRSR